MAEEDEFGDDFGNDDNGGGDDDNNDGGDGGDDAQFEENDNNDDFEGGGGEDDWGDAVEDDGFKIDHKNEKKKKEEKEDGKNDDEKKEDDNKDKTWKCLECEYINPGLGLLCLKCNKPNLGELDRQKKKAEYKDAQFWFKVYTESYLPLQIYLNSKIDSSLQKDVIFKMIEQIYEHEGIGMKVCDLKKWDNKNLKNACDSCTRNFDKKDVIREEFFCHANICKECVTNWVQSKINDDDILPYIRCPGENCSYAIPYDKLISYKLSLVNYYTFAAIYAEKLLARNSSWIFCLTPKCKYGALLGLNESEKAFNCENCNKKHVLKRKNEFDEGFKEMLKQGKIRMCPKCDYPHMKDYGLCNVLQCGKCKIWWNWKTKEMASTSKELKEKARNNHTLWEPGELEYQQKLQKENPEAFKALLESNGVKYNPNYVRGSNNAHDDD